MNLFANVKDNVTPRQAAEYYGMSVNRAGMTKCPFHNDKTPSMKLYDDGYYCFGCLAHGDVIDLTAALYGLSPKMAAERLAEDFGVPYDDRPPTKEERAARENALQRKKRYEELENRCFIALTDYLHILREWKKLYAPSPEHPDGPLHPRFVEACRMYEAVDYMSETLAVGEDDKRRAIVEALSENGKICELEEYVMEIAGGIAE